MTPRQPFLQDLEALVVAPTQAWCTTTDDFEPGSVGVIFSDVQVLAGLALSFDGAPVTWIRRSISGPTAVHVGILRHLQDEEAGADPRVSVIRRREVSDAAVTEQLEIHSTLDTPVSTTLELAFVPALDPIDRVKEGHHEPVTVVAEDGSVHWSTESVRAELTGAATLVVDGSGTTVRVDHPITISARGSATLGWRLDLEAAPSVPVIAAPRLGLEASPTWKASAWSTGPHLVIRSSARAPPGISLCSAATRCGPPVSRARCIPMSAAQLSACSRRCRVSAPIPPRRRRPGRSSTRSGARGSLRCPRATTAPSTRPACG